MSNEQGGKATQIAVRISEELRDRYNRLVERTGRTRAYYMRTALEAQIAEAESGKEGFAEREPAAGALTQVVVRIFDQELRERLDKLVKRTGRTRTYYMRAALEAQIEFLEAAFLGEQELIEQEIGATAPAAAKEPRHRKAAKRAGR